MLIKRASEAIRLKPGGIHPFFLENPEKYHQLKAGGAVEIDEPAASEILALFGISVIVVEPEKPSKPKKNVVE